MDLVEVSVVDAVAEELSHDFFVHIGQVESDTDLGSRLFGFCQEIIDQGIVLGQDAGAYGRVTKKFFYLFRSKMPQTVDFFLPGGSP